MTPDIPAPMKGVRVLEVAQWTFVPAAGAVLADWGADVIKVEHTRAPATPSAACAISVTSPSRATETR